MNRITMVAVLAAACFPAFAGAADCKPVADYKVGYTSYKVRPLGRSLDHLLRGTPYKGGVEGGDTARVKAKRISGPLSLSLDHLAKQAGVQWRQDGCQVIFTARQAQPSAMSRAAPVASASSSMPAATAARMPLPVATAAAASATPTVWTLHADQPIHKQFADWARQAGWTFEWRLEKSWLVPAATQFTGSFDDALSNAVEALHAQGKPVRLILWEGNRFAEIVDVDAK